MQGLKSTMDSHIQKVKEEEYLLEHPMEMNIKEKYGQEQLLL